MSYTKEQKDKIREGLLARKESQQILNGEFTDWLDLKETQLKKLEEVQASFMERTEQWVDENCKTKWFKLEEKIKEIKMEVGSKFLFAGMIISLYGRFKSN